MQKCRICGFDIKPHEDRTPWPPNSENPYVVHKECREHASRNAGANFLAQYERPPDIYELIKRFNDFYRIPSNDTPTNLGWDRVWNFQEILQEEVEEIMNLGESDRIVEEEGLLIIDDLDEGEPDLTELTDWLCDIIVYCLSEGRRWGLPMKEALEIIMESNMSKADESGNPIYDERGKVLKGPNYWKPEPKIAELISRKLAQAEANRPRDGGSALEGDLP